LDHAFSSNRLRGDNKILRIPSAKNGPGNVNSFGLCPEKAEMKAGKQINWLEKWALSILLKGM
jgi:hypothetical protein